MVLDAEEVAALVAVERRGSVPRFEVQRLADAGRPCEPIRKDLIEDCVSDPAGVRVQVGS
jgi:hypothetical protein